MKGWMTFFFHLSFVLCFFWGGGSAWPGKGFGVGGSKCNTMGFWLETWLDTHHRSWLNILLYKEGGLCGDGRCEKGGSSVYFILFFFWAGRGGGTGDLGGGERLVCALEGFFFWSRIVDMFIQHVLCFFFLLLKMLYLSTCLPFTLYAIGYIYISYPIPIYISIHICNSREKRNLFVGKHHK